MFPDFNLIIAKYERDKKFIREFLDKEWKGSQKFPEIPDFIDCLYHFNILHPNHKISYTVFDIVFREYFNFEENHPDF